MAGLKLQIDHSQIPSRTQHSKLKNFNSGCKDNSSRSCLSIFSDLLRHPHIPTTHCFSFVYQLVYPLHLTVKFLLLVHWFLSLRFPDRNHDVIYSNNFGKISIKILRFSQNWIISRQLHIFWDRDELYCWPTYLPSLILIPNWKAAFGIASLFSI